MDPKKTWIYAGIGVVILFLIILLFLPSDKKDKKGAPGVNEKVKFSKNQVVIDDPYFPDAPHPSSEDPKLEAETEKLYPHVNNSKPVDKEKIREEWNRFSAKYPKNIYIPNEFKPPLTPKEEADIKKELDAFTAMDATFASQVAANKYAEEGKDMKTGNEPKPSPEMQNAYFSYKIRELESRLQLVEFAIENNELGDDQKAIAKKDMDAWKSELQKLKDVAKTVPNQ